MANSGPKFGGISNQKGPNSVPLPNQKKICFFVDWLKKVPNQKMEKKIGGKSCKYTGVKHLITDMTMVLICLC